MGSVNMSDSDEDIDYDEARCRKFTLPPIVRYEDLIERYHGTLEIGTGEWIYEVALRAKYKFGYSSRSRLSKAKLNGFGEAGDREKSEFLSTRSSRKRDGDGTNNGRSVRINTPDEKCFKAPLPNMKTTPKRRTKPNDASAATNDTDDTSKNNNNKPVKRQRNGDVFRKPGTLGSRNQIGAYSKQTERQKTLSELTAKGRLRSLIPSQDLIDTQNFVNDDMIASLSEICQRTKMTHIPRDPTTILKSFSIVIPRLSLTDEEIKSVMQDEDIEKIEQMEAPELDVSSDDERRFDANVTMSRGDNLIETVCID